MTWATAVFVSRSGAWIVAQKEDESIVFELVGEEGSIQVCDQIKGNWDGKSASGAALEELVGGVGRHNWGQPLGSSASHQR